MNRWFVLQHDEAPLRASTREPLDVTPDALSYQDGRERSVEVGIRSRDLVWMFSLVGIVMTVFLGRALLLQTVRGAHYRSVAETNRTRTLVTPAVRGVIYDAWGVQLVQNAPAFTLVVTPADLPKDPTERNHVIETTARLGNINPTDIDIAIAEFPPTTTEAIPVDVPLPYTAALRLYTETDRLPGIEVELLTTRAYVTTPLQSLSHVLGYTGFISPEEYQDRRTRGYLRTDKIGKQGIESTHETELRGTNGYRTVEVDALGREVLLLRQEQPVAGANLTLTIDTELTTFIEERLTDMLTRTQKTRASVVVVDPKTGGVRALISVPSYNNNAFAEGISGEAYTNLITNEDHPLFPRAVLGEFPPGSTFKPTVAAIALEDGIIDRNTSFLSTGGIAINSWFFPDWKAGGHGVTNVTKAIAESVNTFFYIVGGGYGDVRGLGIERMMNGARLFGFGAETGIDLPQEASGFLPSMSWKEAVKGERWYIGDTYHAAIGQGDVLVTPLQIAMATSVFANGGTLFKPHLVAKQEHTGEEVLTPSEVLNPQVVSPSTVNVVRDGMRQTVVNGSARSLSTLPQAVAAKTGTAQAGGERDNHAWFTAFGPFENPELVVTVLVEEGGEGSSVAAPIAKDIFSWWFTHRSPPSRAE